MKLKFHKHKGTITFNNKKELEAFAELIEHYMDMVWETPEKGFEEDYENSADQMADKLDIELAKWKGIDIYEKLKCFEIDTGVSEWIIAKTRKEALIHFLNNIDHEDEDLENLSIHEEPEDVMKRYKFKDEQSGQSRSFKEEFDRCLSSSEIKFPYTMASSEY